MADGQERIRRGRKFDQVLDGAREIFLRDGFDGANVDDIAKAAGVSKATLYAYFPDKRQLFQEVARTECRRQAGETFGFLDASQPAESNLREAAKRLVSLVASPFGIELYRIGVAEAGRFPQLGREFYRSGPENLSTILANYLRAAIANGQFEIEDVELAADQFMELCKANILARLVFGVVESCSDEMADRVIDGAVHMFMTTYGRR